MKMNRGRSGAQAIAMTEFLVLLAIVAIASIVMAMAFGEQLKTAYNGAIRAMLGEGDVSAVVATPAIESSVMSDFAKNAGTVAGLGSGTSDVGSDSQSSGILAWLDDQVRSALPPELAQRFRGLENPNWEAAKQQALHDGSLLIDILPVAGTVKAVYELESGKDPFTDEEKSRVASAIGLAFSLIPGGKTLSKAAVEVVEEASVKGLLRFTQKTASQFFSKEGDFAGKTISDVASALRAGTLSEVEVPVEFIIRDGNRLIVNTRSSLALRQAGIPESKWNLIDRSGVPEVEARITERLRHNDLSNEGTDVLRITGSGSNASTYEAP